METDYRILNLYKTKQYNECLKLCGEELQHKNDRMVEFIHMRVLAIQAKIAGNGYEEVEYFSQQDDLVTTSIAKTPRPGTSFQRQAKTAQLHLDKRTATAATVRTRAGTNASRARTALHTASQLSRAATALVDGTPFAPGAGVPLSLRLLSKEDNLFVAAAKTLFEYVYYCEGDIRKAMEIAYQAQKSDDNIYDWWWHFSLGRCYYTLQMFRHAEESLRQALKQNKHVSIYLRLVAMYVGLNQPISALECCKQGISAFHEYTPLMLEKARIHYEMGNMTQAIKEYRMVAIADPTNVEAIANIAMYNFYNDQPEIALRYYRRLLATNTPGPEIYNNLGLCCLYCNQWDLILPCFRQALYLSTNPETRADLWFNISHVALSTGDIALFRRCLQACLAMNSEHSAARKALQALHTSMRARKAYV